MKKIIFFCFLIYALVLAGCANDNPLTSSGIHNGFASSAVSSESPKNSNADIVSTAAWRSLGNGPYDVRIISGYPGLVSTADNRRSAYSQMEAFLKKAVVYTKAIPKSDSYTEHAGYIGPPCIAFSNKSHTVKIIPAWYVKVTDNTIHVEYVSGVLQVTADQRVSFIQSQSLYNWLKENKWKTSFHDE